MDAKEYWKLFMETGAPELYMLYRQKLEERNVLERSSAGPSCNGLQ